MGFGASKKFIHRRHLDRACVAARHVTHSCQAGQQLLQHMYFSRQLAATDYQPRATVRTRRSTHFMRLDLHTYYGQPSIRCASQLIQLQSAIHPSKTSQQLIHEQGRGDETSSSTELAYSDVESTRYAG